MKLNKVFWILLTALIVSSLLLAACGGGATPTEEAPPPPEEETAPEEPSEPPADIPEVSFPYPAGGYLEKALAGEYTGTTVSVDGPFTSPDTELFLESMEAFEEATGITVNYIGDKEFEARLAIAVDAGDAPDIADFPQPGAMANYARQGYIVDPATFISDDWLSQQYNQSWLDMGTVEGPDGSAMYGGVWHRFNGKSLVWYPKDDF
ncbi:MAG: extracellular solute-binding protein, partial [Anaerolineales bacterium]|nr:extracellular solute-binding protein [Anaerolineales bacterium]